MRTLWLPLLLCSLMGVKTIFGDLGLSPVKELLQPKEKEDAPKEEASSKAVIHHSGSLEDRGRLISSLFSGYDKRNYPTNATLQFGLALINVDVDEDSSTLEAQAWLRMIWNDPRLSWDQAEYDVGVLRISSDEVWKPDVTLYNSADHPGMVKCWSSNVVLYSNGNVLWVPPCHLSAFCDTDNLSREPYGPLKCHLKFGSWTFDGYLLSLAFYNGTSSADLKYLGSTSRWDVVGNEATLEDKFYSCCAEPYPVITYNITVQRHGHCH